jgi:hypothetical protein
MESWTQLTEIARKQTGRKVVGTGGGLFMFSDTELCVPLGNVEGLVHDLCHWVVASTEERKQPNMGLSQDWTHPGWDRMVRCEELAWSLEMFLFGDPTSEEMLALMTPEARASGGGYYNTSSYVALPTPLTLKQSANAVAARVTEAALVEMEYARELVIGNGELRPDGNEKIRREALAKAVETGLPVKDIQRIVRAWWLAQYSEGQERPDEDDELETTWKVIRPR